MFEADIKVNLTIYGYVEFAQPPSWIFSKGVSLRFWVKISNFFQLCKWCNKGVKQRGF